MKIVYVSDDGLSFDNQFDCEKHEFDVFMKTIKIKVYDQKRHRLDNISESETYNESYRVVIADEKDLSDIKRIYNWTGYYCDIDSIGTWIYNEDKNRFIRKEDFNNTTEK